MDILTKRILSDKARQCYRVHRASEGSSEVRARSPFSLGASLEVYAETVAALASGWSDACYVTSSPVSRFSGRR
jgi:hypothetical protein